ncbi:MAG: TMEM165/GDT1 family protein [Bdellovibrio sp.]|jgi:putative Ca2+/H+ antiporter (TMEM165/GDT1 family)
MEALIQSFLLVAASEMGDKTQLLAFVLASRFRKPWTILAGIFAATLLNHLLAATLGQGLAQLISPQVLKYGLALVFFAFALWILIPDKDEELKQAYKWGAFATTFVAFFMAEMGDKTQLATVALSARFQDLVNVTIGTTLGMIISDGLAVFLGDRLSEKISMTHVRYFASALFAIFGVGILLYPF